MSSSNLPRASLINALKWLGIVLVVPILPFLILGDAFEARVQQGIESVSSTSYLAALIITALSLDIFLPIPSSGVSTFAGQTLGLFWGTITSWVGMTVGACMGFATAKWLGKSVFKKYSSEDDQAALSQFGEQHGDILLIATRALPLLAEASVLLLGTTSYPWRKFLPWVLLMNLIISLLYAGLGEWANANNQETLILLVSLFLPVAIAVIVRLLLLSNRHAKP